MSKRKGTGRKPGRPKGKPLSEKERAQRRAAPLKHGAHAATALAQALPPCKPAACPLEDPVAPKGGAGYPCEIKQAIEAGGGGLSSCLVALGEEHTIEQFKAAILRGDTQGIAELAAMSLAAKSALEHRGLKQLVAEGLTVEQPIIGRGEGGPEIIGSRTVENPVGRLVLQLGEHLGRTAKEQVITPGARGETARDEALTKLTHIAWMGMMRRQLRGGDEDV